MRRRCSTLFACLLALLLSCSVFASTAQAANDFVYASVDCKATSADKRGGFFPTQVIGKSCDTIDKRQENSTAIFSIIVCNFVGVMNDVLTRMYCGMQAAFMPIIVATISLYVIIFGAQLLIGSAQLSGGEVAKHLLKIGGVWLFATQGAWGVGMIYNFFVGLSVQGIDWVLKIVEYCNHDKCLFDASAATSATGIFSFIDARLYGVVQQVFFGNDRAPLVAFFLILSSIQPAIFMMALSLVWMTLTIFVRALMTFLMGITAVAFLIALSPIFLCFMLFKSTAQFFESWLRYIISYSLQPIITFACLALWIGITLSFLDFATQLANTLKPYQSLQTTGVVFNPVDTVGICPLAYENSENGPTIKCRDNNPSDEHYLPPSKMVEEPKFMYFLAYHLVSLLVIAYAFSSMLKSAPDIARQLAGPVSIQPLGTPFSEGGSGGIETLRSTVSGISDFAGKGAAGGVGAVKDFAKKFGEMMGNRSPPK